MWRMLETVVAFWHMDRVLIVCAGDACLFPSVVAEVIWLTITHFMCVLVQALRLSSAAAALIAPVHGFVGFTRSFSQDRKQLLNTPNDLLLHASVRRTSMLHSTYR